VEKLIDIGWVETSERPWEEDSDYSEKDSDCEDNTKIIEINQDMLESNQNMDENDTEMLEINQDMFENDTEMLETNTEMLEPTEIAPPKNKRASLKPIATFTYLNYWHSMNIEDNETRKIKQRDQEKYEQFKGKWCHTEENWLQGDALHTDKGELLEAIVFASKKGERSSLPQITGPYLGFWKFETFTEIGLIEIFKWP
jgi:hypothetical protein